MTTKFYASKAAVIRHAMSYYGTDWDQTYAIFPVELPGGEMHYTLAGKADIDNPPVASSRISAGVERKSAVSSFIAHSRVQGATKRVWDIADSMKGRARRDILEACREQGIASGTAATQYQRWKSANKL